MSKVKWDIPETQNDSVGDIPSMTVFVDLPSKGLYYPEEVFTNNMESCEIKFVSGKEEAILINKDYARNGLTIHKFISALFVDERMKMIPVMDSLMIADVSALALAGRNSAYGPEYEVKTKCPNCGNIQQNTYDLSEPKHNCGYVDNQEELEGQVEWLGGDKFKVLSTPLKKDEIVFRLLNHRDEMNMRKALRSKKDYGFKEQYTPLILSVNGEKGANVVSDYLDNTPAFDLKYIRNLINLCTPELDLKQEFFCSSCGFSENEFEIPITENFLIPH